MKNTVELIRENDEFSSHFAGCQKFRNLEHFSRLRIYETFEFNYVKKFNFTFFEESSDNVTIVVSEKAFQ